MLHCRGVVLAALATALVACGGGDGGGYGTSPSTSPGSTSPGGSSPGSVATNSITIGDASFTPAIVNVTLGTTVTWQWNSCPDGAGGYSSCVAHNVTFDDGSGIASSTQTTGTFSRMFNAAGTYKYHCTIHGAGMNGSVVVK